MEHRGYDIHIDKDNVAVVSLLGIDIWKSRACRLKVQAERLAKDWIDGELGIQPAASTLKVQNYEVDAKSLFQRRK